MPVKNITCWSREYNRDMQKDLILNIKTSNLECSAKKSQTDPNSYSDPNTPTKILVSWYLIIIKPNPTTFFNPISTTVTLLHFHAHCIQLLAKETLDFTFFNILHYKLLYLANVTAVINSFLNSPSYCKSPLLFIVVSAMALPYLDIQLWKTDLEHGIIDLAQLRTHK